MSYHSLEDRMVKGALRDAETGGCTCPPGLECVCGARPTVRLLKRGAWTADDDEVRDNPRARSVRLRAAEALGPDPEQAGRGPAGSDRVDSGADDDDRPAGDRADGDGGVEWAS